MKKIIILCLLLCSINDVYGQQGLPFYNHYLVGDKMLINPSYAGQNPDIISINGTYRNQWDDLPDSPNTQTLSVHGTVVDRLAVGAYFFNDRNSSFEETVVSEEAFWEECYTEDKYMLCVVAWNKLYKKGLFECVRYEKWLLSHIFMCQKGFQCSYKQAWRALSTFWPLYHIMWFQANENYAKHLNKQVQFTLICPDDFKTKEHTALLAVLNNLVANAVEAIQDSGFITLSVSIQSDMTTFIIEDNGVGIDEALLPIIFDVGYTSKFNEQGQASTGIGLSHTKMVSKK